MRAHGLPPSPWRLWIPPLAVWVALAASCTPPPPGTLKCEGSRDCAFGYVCDEHGRCVTRPDAGEDSPLDAGSEGKEDASVDPEEDAGFNPGLDAGDDGGPPLDPDSGPDAGQDAGQDAGSDGGQGVPDGGEDAGEDAGPPDEEPTLQLFAVHPEIAAVGDTVVLEGQFPAGNYTVWFGDHPLSISVPPSSRIVLSVPEGATSDGISVSDGVESTAALPFRVTSFTPRIGFFSTELEQTMSARSMSAPSGPLEKTFAFSTGTHLNLVEERGSGGFIESARIYADGSLSPFAAHQDLSGPIIEGRAYVRVGSWLYAIGGRRGGNVLDRVDRALITDGVLGDDFSQAVGTLTGTRAYASAVVIGRWLYVLGGRSTDDRNTTLDSIERAPILDDGALGQFETVDPELNHPRDHSSAHVVGSWLYVVGGTDSNHTIERAPIDLRGDLGPFQAVGSLLNFTGRRAHAGLVLGEDLCVIGGQTGDTPIASVQCARVGSDPSLTFVDAGDLLYPRAFTGVAVAGNRLFVFGGTDSISTSRPAEWAPIEYGAHAHAVSLPPVPTDIPDRRDMACAIVEDRVLVTGGQSENMVGADEREKGVYVAEISADGDLGVFTSLTELNTGRSGHRLAVHDGTVWVIGGEGIGSADPSIEVATIGEETLSFEPSGSQLPVNLSQFYSFFADGRLYVAGGSPAPSSTFLTCMDATGGISIGAHCGSAWLWPVAPAGAVLPGHAWLLGGMFAEVPQGYVLGATLSSSALMFANESSLSLSQARHSALSVLVGGRLHVFGGRQNGEGFANQVEVLEIGLDGAHGDFQSDRTLPGDVTGGCVFAVKNRLHVLTPAITGGSHVQRIGGELRDEPAP